MEILKYPRTRHVEGSRFQLGDTKDDLPRADLDGKFIVIEEKVDGANAGLSFDADGQLYLQSRGHFLTGGGRERHFDMFKTWGYCHKDRLFDAIGSRYIVYGEWIYAKHTVFYDQLAHYFMEFDVFDREAQVFLSTAKRREVLAGLPILPVPILFEGEMTRDVKIESFVRPSLYKSASWVDNMLTHAGKLGQDAARTEKETDASDLSEGLYFKVEAEGVTRERYKFVRSDFVQALVDSDSHWQTRPILPNLLANGVDIFAPKLGLKGAYDE